MRGSRAAADTHDEPPLTPAPRLGRRHRKGSDRDLGRGQKCLRTHHVAARHPLPGLGDMVAVQMGILEGDESSSPAEVVG